VLLRSLCSFSTAHT